MSDAPGTDIRTSELSAPTRLTALEAATVRANVLTVAQPGATVSLRLAAVRRVDACGLGLLLDLHRTLRTRDARFVCEDPSPLLLLAMRRLGIDRIVAIEADPARADPAQAGPDHSDDGVSYRRLVSA